MEKPPVFQHPVKEIYENGLFLALEGNFDEFCERIVNWTVEEIQDFKRWMGIIIPTKTSPPTADTAQVVTHADAEASNSTEQIDPPSVPPPEATKDEPPRHPENRDGAGRTIQPKLDPSRRASKLRVVKRSEKPAPATNRPATVSSGSKGDKLQSAHKPTGDEPSQAPLVPPTPAAGLSSRPESATQGTPVSCAIASMTSTTRCAGNSGKAVSASALWNCSTVRECRSTWRKYARDCCTMTERRIGEACTRGTPADAWSKSASKISALALSRAIHRTRVLPSSRRHPRPCAWAATG